jgi:transposase InsO family protein
MSKKNIRNLFTQDLKISQKSVWATDITYIPMAKGFYLTAIIDLQFVLNGA